MRPNFNKAQANMMNQRQMPNQQYQNAGYKELPVDEK